MRWSNLQQQHSHLLREKTSFKRRKQRLLRNTAYSNNTHSCCNGKVQQKERCNAISEYMLSKNVFGDCRSETSYSTVPQTVSARSHSPVHMCGPTVKYKLMYSYAKFFFLNYTLKITNRTLNCSLKTVQHVHTNTLM